MKTFYIEILHPHKNEVMWHYYAKAVSEDAAKEAPTKKFIEEQSDGLLLETGGLFMVTAAEEK